MKKAIIILSVMALIFGFGGKAFTESFEEQKQDIEALVKSAAETIHQKGIVDAMYEISKKDGRFCTKNSYVYMMNMDAVVMAHPYLHDLIGKNLSSWVLKDKDGNDRPMMLVNLAKQKGSGWTSYLWPKPGEKNPSEKFCYILKVDDTNVFLAAGFYPEQA